MAKLVVTVATPLLTATLVPPVIAKPLLVKVTVPSFTVLVLVTVAVKVTELLGAAVKEGLLLEEMPVLVAAAGALSVPDTAWFIVLALLLLNATLPDIVPTVPVPANRT